MKPLNNPAYTAFRELTACITDIIALIHALPMLHLDCIMNAGPRALNLTRIAYFHWIEYNVKTINGNAWTPAMGFLPKVALLPVGLIANQLIQIVFSLCQELSVSTRSGSALLDAIVRLLRAKSSLV